MGRTFLHLSESAMKALQISEIDLDQDEIPAEVLEKMEEDGGLPRSD